MSIENSRHFIFFVNISEIRVGCLPQNMLLRISIWKGITNSSENLDLVVKVKYSVVQIIGKLGRFMMLFFFALLEWLPTLNNSKYMGLFR